MGLLSFVRWIAGQAAPVEQLVSNQQPLPVGVQPRACLGVARLAITTGAAVSLTTASGGIPIPAGAVTAELQADGGSVRLRRDASSPTASVGYRLDDGAEKVVDSDLAAVRLIAQTVACAVNVAYFDKV